MSLKGYRSVDGWLHLDFPRNEPLVLLGENNAGKSNILRAVNFMFGDFWPGSHRPEDHEYFGRSPEGREIKISAAVENLSCNSMGCKNSLVTAITWKYAPDDEQVCEFTRTADHCAHTYVNNELRQSLFCMSVGVNRDLSYQLSYGSKWTTLSKLMRRFHDRLIADPDRLVKLQGIFQSLVDTFHEVEEFQSFGLALKQSFADFGGNLKYGLGVDFSAYDPSNYFRSLRVFPHVDGVPRTYEELGTGQEQVLAMAFAHAYATAFGGDGLVLAIEEPESHLHPLAQQWLSKKMRVLASTGVQVIVTTHSPYFVDIAKPWTTAFIRKDNEAQGTAVTQHSAESLAARLVELGSPAEVTNAATVGSFYESASSYDTLAGFFSRACVVVEGATEHLGLPVLLERAGLDLLQEGIAVIPVEGITNMAKWVRLYRSYGLPVFAIFDTDTDKPAADAATSAKCAAEVLLAMGVTSEQTHHSGELTIFDLSACFDPNYEVAMRKMFGEQYTSLEIAAATSVGKSKQLRARHCARNVDYPGEEGLSGWRCMADLVSAIRANLPSVTVTDATPATVQSPAERASGVSRTTARQWERGGRSRS